MKELTKAEEQIMHIVWKLEKVLVHDVIEKLPEPKPAYNTVSTIIRILEKKGFVDHRAYGKTYEYFPLVSKEEYKAKFLKGFVKNYFSDSYKQLVSFFSNDNNLSIADLEEIRNLLDEKINLEKNN